MINLAIEMAKGRTQIVAATGSQSFAETQVLTDFAAKAGVDASFRIFVGLEELSFPMLALGACGLMNAVGNLMPGPVARLYEATAGGDLEAGPRAHYELLELNRAVLWDTNPIPIKDMAKRLGIIPSNEHRLPMVPATPELERRLDALLRSLSLIET